mmetsp:Transcript_326/g.422  ORF Transcript_326/g.422 Transcript_326/m.422 type:complete len:162 (-) Transcript_326:136-621(-)|eukprot:CAMPEP_0206184074 /NCGR_PEP_ID=MMETSP0166-20121206/1011_1 /ASSEMBLY_ACC=CAM_ASM_000260 /TAXON_ID=95228 /ORGANISM="Vannella robusta, Strain DIVA3 518/3/11/1/6" /LENGTH=161 /DNA_ID=CAMNT_0053599039 /DNA_START=723 /DNA_END=1208 /DNA_ORIENTATION=-
MSDPRRPNVVNGADFFSQPPPDENQTASTSMGHASGTQQLYPPGGAPARNRTARRPQNTGNITDNMNMDTLYQPVNMFGVEVKLYVLLIIAAVAYYVWGFPGVISIGVAYWISKNFGPQAPAAEQPNQGNFQPVNRNNVAPAAPLRSSTSDRFPGKGNTLS